MIATAETVLAGRNLTRTFEGGGQETVAVRDVTLELRRGEVTVLLGPSGSGKTTLLTILAALQRPDQGQVIALGRDLWAMSESERESFRLEHFGFVFQGYHLFPALTARQQLEMILCWGQSLTLAEARPRVREFLAILGLEHKANSRPDQLSGGEKQRVAIGRALIKQPSFCFADEPTSALDWERGRRVIELMQIAARTWGCAVLIVSHDPRVIPMADRAFELQDGRMMVG
jgi:putative ABC transport system ATP-binding protein